MTARFAESPPEASRTELRGSAAGGEDLLAAGLVRRAREGDRAALATLLKTHAPKIAATCHHLVGPTDARDAAQEAFERIVRELSRFDPARGAFRPWALSIARNVCRDRLRRRGLERAAFSADGAADTERAEAPDAGPERIAIVKEDASALGRALEGLPTAMREALVMFHIGEASYEDIARALDVPMGTVMTWLHRGRARLRAAIEEP